MNNESLSNQHQFNPFSFDEESKKWLDELDKKFSDPINNLTSEQNSNITEDPVINE